VLLRHFYQNLMPDFKPQSCLLDKRNLQPSALSFLFLEKLAFGVVQHWVFAQSLAPVE